MKIRHFGSPIVLLSFALFTAYITDSLPGNWTSTVHFL